MNEKLKEILERVLDENIDSIREADNFRSLEFWDSIMYVKLVGALQSEFSLTFSKEQIAQLLTFSGIVKVLAEHGVGR